MSDVDGVTTLILDSVNAEYVNFDMFLQNTSYETSTPIDYLVILFNGTNSQVQILNPSLNMNLSLYHSKKSINIFINKYYIKLKN